MGMFDYVNYKGAIYQTKDLSCVMETLTITEDGRLVHDESHWEPVEKKDRPHPNDDGLLGMMGSFKTVVDRENVDLNYHGYLNFYRHTDSGKWEEFNAKFTDGKLVEILPTPQTLNGKEA
jgi:hypothetical protein